MLDVLLVGEVVWCSLWFRAQGLERALMLAGGVVAAGYTSVQASPWFTRIFVSSANAVFAWIDQHITTDARVVAALSSFLPPAPTAVTGDFRRWLAMQVVRVLFVAVISISVFCVFWVCAYLADALWDRDRERPTRAERALATLAGIATGLYSAVLTAHLAIDLAWLRDLQFLSEPVAGSLLLKWLP